MRNYYSVLLVILVSLPTLLLANVPVSGNTTAQPQQLSQEDLTSRTSEIINTDGNLSLSPEQNEIYWNPHSVGLTDNSHWTITYDNEVEMHLETTESVQGHIATGAWWITSFKTKQKLPLYTTKPIRITATFTTNIVNAKCKTGNEWLRIALACAVQRTDGSVVYTEMDLWDSPTAIAHPSGNTRLGGNVVYQGGDVVEYKVDQLVIGQWTTFTLNLTQNINNAWQLKPGDVLESVYFVVEAAGAVNATVKADDLLIVRLD